MEKIFLDVNVFIDIAYRKPLRRISLEKKDVYIFPISVHILCYLNKIKVPNQALQDFLGEYNIITLTQKILDGALKGPTDDFEDNVQLHSAAQADCDLFLTEDKKLLKLAYFGKVAIVSKVEA
ncbi:hypothetical protein A3F03_01665 [Candidatus Roizmanbacteria bacterium RIFCSPHIGHO2_12_FULL_41_11]|uniref:PIN domain-containing protein n=1 Tax=Candidatus Roizmanbacteria bacterium RIFCSPHIGHO2_12_FULL_41_11 TaxID=1802052 RepID=A0A1F7I315_9BACT|nr:MAG: hypothetical protein A3F03_01665 [Candidatus Roizmanbacteria bacterium RIFCSPHIGHO2_12_FULL_41_11]